MADFPGAERRTACYFSLSNTPIAGGGWDGTNYFVDYYSYQTITNTWTAIPDLGGIGCHTPVSFSATGLGYVGTGGIPNNGTTTQFWEYFKSVNTSVNDADPTDELSVVITADTLTFIGAPHFQLVLPIRSTTRPGSC